MALADSRQTRYLNEYLEHQKFHVCPFVILWRFASSRRCSGLPLRHTLYYTVRLVRTSSRRCRPEKLSLCQPSSYICPVTLLLLPKKLCIRHLPVRLHLHRAHQATSQTCESIASFVAAVLMPTLQTLGWENSGLVCFRSTPPEHFSLVNNSVHRDQQI